MVSDGEPKRAEDTELQHTVDYLRERARRADVKGMIELLDQIGGNEPPREGDEL
jgi:hypothetical protein